MLRWLTIGLLVSLLVPARASAQETKEADDGAAEAADGAGDAEKSSKSSKKAVWAKRAEELKLNKAGMSTNILWGKIPKAVQEAAGGFTRPKYFKWPVPGGRFGRGFGSGKNGKHKALDIVAPMGTPVLAAAAGLIVWAGTKKGYGKTVIILHSGGWATLYAHLSKYHVSVGMLVASRQKIAAVGNTGISRGPHLHFMWFDNGVLRDPAPLMHPSIPHPPHVPPMPFKGHTVKQGQTPAQIAQLYGVETSDLLAANGMKSGESFMAGWRIIIPKKIKQLKFEKGYYTVKKGDTIAAIAVLYDVSIKELKAINFLKDEDVIQPDMKIKLPEGVYSGKAMSQAGGSGDESAAEGLDTYVVKDGDSLFIIAKKYNTAITKIVSLNGIKNPDKIKPGSKLLVPAKPKKKGKKAAGKGKKSAKGKKKKKEAALEEEAAEEADTVEVVEEPDFSPVTEEELDLQKVEGFEGEGVEVYEVNEE
jgi:murein DD-endopeptidase MepM/ murein hydrolase activator NlpD